MPPFAALTAGDPQEIGGYRLCARLGSGGMGHVYLAYTPAGRPVALKSVRPELAADPEFRRRFAQEVASARRIHGLYTAQLVDASTAAATPWLATAYVPGPSLHDVVRLHGPLPERAVLLLMAGVAEALQAIHGAGVVHRDLKPANVLLAADGPRVIDFGIARAADAVALTGAGLRIGTPSFMAPEQATGRPATAASDVFALGALAVYAASGSPPFGAGCPESVALYRVVHDEPELGRVPHEVRELIRGCLAKDPGQRPTPGGLIEAVRRHPAVGGRLLFSDDWLPPAVRHETALRGELPEPVESPHAQPTVAAPQATLHAGSLMSGPGAYPTPGPPSGPGTYADPEPYPVAGAPATPHHLEARTYDHDPEAAPAERGRGSGKRLLKRLLLTLLVVALLAAGVAAYRHTRAGNEPEARPDRTGSASPQPTSEPSRKPTTAPPPEFRAGYQEAELTAPDASYEFDLRSGTVAPESTADWYLAPGADAFEFPEDSDAYIGQGEDLTPEECVEGIESEPVTELPYAALANGDTFCLRSADGRELVLGWLVEVAPDSDSVTVAVSHYRSS
ncbi:serine/threonine-protein kinase [Streptomyces sp. NA04227]|uniref:serine/threonine-protein kinase n=1 Tax=Streptomyces sp. NA04227 TaxID=2742136 RepID=UPI0020CA9C4F|nr:serine/threonine-protein kinase [Streptomyces sp. NA04227]